MKNIIWTNDIDYKDWKKDLEEQYPDKDGYDEEKRIKLMYDINNDYLGDERINLDIELGNVIVVFADLGLWNGRKIGYKFIGSNINDIFDSALGDYVTWYVEENEIKCKDCHHDGTNYYTYHVLKDEYSKDDFEEEAFGVSVQSAMEKMTEPIGHYAAEVYGFNMEE